MIASLRGRLVAGVLALAAAGMLLVGGITYATQRSFLLDRVDTQLASAVDGLQREFIGRNGGNQRFKGRGGPPPGGGAPSDTYGQLRDTQRQRPRRASSSARTTRARRPSCRRTSRWGRR